VGIVSTAAGPWKTWRGGHLDSLLRLDIGAYPRSSGSAVLDAHGRFAGMLTSGLTRTAPIAIPAVTIHRVATELLEHGSLAHGYLGVGLQAVLLPPAFAAQLKREQRSAIMVLSVAPGGPAEQTGILLGDIVAGIGPNPTTDIDDLQTAIRGAVGKQLPVEILRSGQRVELQVTVGQRRSKQ
jgi:S1-C subfamily serine protease